MENLPNDEPQQPESAWEIALQGGKEVSAHHVALFALKKLFIKLPTTMFLTLFYIKKTQRKVIMSLSDVRHVVTLIFLLSPPVLQLAKKSIQRKVHDPDFKRKREVISLNQDKNVDHDLDFVAHKSLIDDIK